MKVTEKEAKEKLCPLMIGKLNNIAWQGYNCYSNECMAWRWVNAPMADIPTGYCGLAGRLEEFIRG